MQLFADEERAKIKAANSDATFGTITSMIATAWKNITAEDKQCFVNLHEVVCAECMNLILNVHIHNLH
jgi:hypothetical protein